MDANWEAKARSEEKCAGTQHPECYWMPPGAIKTQDDAYHWCERFVQSLGYEFFFFVIYFPVTPRRKLELASTNYPLAWRQRYEACDYLSIDPVARGVVTWSRPFTWRSVRDEADERARPFWEEARQHGLRDGLVVPIRCAAGGRASLVIAGASVPEDLEAVKYQLGMAMGFISELTEQLYERVLVDRWRKRRGTLGVLTPHQIRILQMLASGMTVKGVARQLNISSRAVQHAMERVLARLGARNTLEAKFSAWSLGLIEPGFEILNIADIDQVSLLEE
jgi:LuxR family transcriptional regulator